MFKDPTRRQKYEDQQRRQAALRADAARMKRENEERRAQEAEEVAARENARRHKEAYDQAKEAEAALARIKGTDSVKAKKALANANAAIGKIETLLEKSKSKSKSPHFLAHVLAHEKPRPRITTLRVQGGRRNRVKRQTVKKHCNQ